MRIGVKICGISSAAGLDACIEADVDWIGLVFFPRSPRHVTPARARALADRLPATIGPVGLFVAPTDDDIARVLGEVSLAALQVYGPDSVQAIRDRFGVPVWHACPVSSALDLPSTTDADRLVVEGKAPASDRPGGNGAALNPSFLRGWTAPASWLLAGGLTPDTVSTAIQATGAQAVDVSSGVEDGAGSKDRRAILAFTHNARQCGPGCGQAPPVRRAAQ